MHGTVRRLLSEASYAFAIKIGAIFTGFIVNVFLGRYLGVSGTGVYYFSITAITIASTVAVLGLDNAAMKFVAINYNKKNKINGLLLHGRNRVFISAMAVLSVLFFMAFFIYFFRDETLGLALFVASLAVPSMAVCVLLGGYLRGLSKVVSAVAIPNALPQFLALLIMLAFVLSPISFSVFNAIYSLLISYVLVSLWGWRYTYIKPCPTKGDDESILGEEKKSFERHGRELVFFNVALQINQWFSVFFIGIVLDASTVGLVSTSVKTASMISILLVALNVVVSPKIAYLFSEKDFVGLKVLLRRSSLLVCAAAFFPILIIGVYAEKVMLVFGEEFVTGANILRVIILGQMVNVLTGPVGAVLAMTGYEGKLKNSALYSCGLCVALNLVLVPCYGAYGAAVSTAACVSYMSLHAWFVVKRELGIAVLPSVR